MIQSIIEIATELFSLYILQLMLVSCKPKSTAFLFINGTSTKIHDTQVSLD